MSKTRIDDEMMRQVMERAWLIMAFISSALSDHPIVKSNRLYRHHTDRSRKALFDLYNEVESALLDRGAILDPSPAMLDESKSAEITKDDFGAKLLRLKCTISPDVRLGFDNDDPPTRGRRSRQRKRRS